MMIVAGIVITLIISFLWALFSLKKELKRVRGGEVKPKDYDHDDENSEVVLFDRTNSK